jgi:flagellar protein FlhE
MACALAMTSALAHAGDLVWNKDGVSPAINYAGRQVVATYAFDAKPGSRVAAVHASRSYHGSSIVQTSLCFGKANNCVPMPDGQLMTHGFDGMDAAGPVYLVHEVVGKGALPAPVFVKGSVAVWFSPPASPGR